MSCLHLYGKSFRYLWLLYNEANWRYYCIGFFCALGRVVRRLFLLMLWLHLHGKSFRYLWLLYNEANWWYYRIGFFYVLGGVVRRLLLLMLCLHLYGKSPRYLWLLYNYWFIHEAVWQQYIIGFFCASGRVLRRLLPLSLGLCMYGKMFRHLLLIYNYWFTKAPWLYYFNDFYCVSGRVGHRLLLPTLCWNRYKKSLRYCILAYKFWSIYKTFWQYNYTDSFCVLGKVVSRLLFRILCMHQYSKLSRYLLMVYMHWMFNEVYAQSHLISSFDVLSRRQNLACILGSKLLPFKIKTLQWYFSFYYYILLSYCSYLLWLIWKYSSHVFWQYNLTGFFCDSRKAVYLFLPSLCMHLYIKLLRNLLLAYTNWINYGVFSQRHEMVLFGDMSRLAPRLSLLLACSNVYGKLLWYLYMSNNYWIYQNELWISYAFSRFYCKHVSACELGSRLLFCRKKILYWSLLLYHHYQVSLCTNIYWLLCPHSCHSLSTFNCLYQVMHSPYNLILEITIYNYCCSSICLFPLLSKIFLEILSGISSYSWICGCKNYQGLLWQYETGGNSALGRVVFRLFLLSAYVLSTRCPQKDLLTLSGFLGSEILTFQCSPLPGHTSVTEATVTQYFSPSNYSWSFSLLRYYYSFNPSLASVYQTLKASFYFLKMSLSLRPQPLHTMKSSNFLRLLFPITSDLLKKFARLGTKKWSYKKGYLKCELWKNSSKLYWCGTRLRHLLLHNPGYNMRGITIKSGKWERMWAHMKSCGRRIMEKPGMESHKKRESNYDGREKLHDGTEWGVERVFCLVNKVEHSRKVRISIDFNKKMIKFRGDRNESLKVMNFVRKDRQINKGTNKINGKKRLYVYRRKGRKKEKERKEKLREVMADKVVKIRRRMNKNFSRKETWSGKSIIDCHKDKKAKLLEILGKNQIIQKLRCGYSSWWIMRRAKENEIRIVVKSLKWEKRNSAREQDIGVNNKNIYIDGLEKEVKEISIDVLNKGVMLNRVGGHDVQEKSLGIPNCFNPIETDWIENGLDEKSYDNLNISHVHEAEKLKCIILIDLHICRKENESKNHDKKRGENRENGNENGNYMNKSLTECQLIRIWTCLNESTVMSKMELSYVRGSKTAKLRMESPRTSHDVGSLQISKIKILSDKQYCSHMETLEKATNCAFVRRMSPAKRSIVISKLERPGALKSVIRLLKEMKEDFLDIKLREMKFKEIIKRKEELRKRVSNIFVTTSAKKDKMDKETIKNYNFRHPGKSEKLKFRNLAALQLCSLWVEEEKEFQNKELCYNMNMYFSDLDCRNWRNWKYDIRANTESFNLTVLSHIPIRWNFSLIYTKKCNCRKVEGKRALNEITKDLANTLNTRVISCAGKDRIKYIND